MPQEFNSLKQCYIALLECCITKNCCATRRSATFFSTHAFPCMTHICLSRPDPPVVAEATSYDTNSLMLKWTQPQIYDCSHQGVSGEAAAGHSRVPLKLKILHPKKPFWLTLHVLCPHKEAPCTPKATSYFKRTRSVSPTTYSFWLSHKKGRFLLFLQRDICLLDAWHLESHIHMRARVPTHAHTHTHALTG